MAYFSPLQNGLDPRIGLLLTTFRGLIVMHLTTVQMRRQHGVSCSLVPGPLPKVSPGRDIYRPVRNLIPKALADRALVAALEVSRGAGEGELLLFGGHRWQGIYESFGPRSGKDDLAYASFTVPADEELPVSGDVVRELFSAHLTPPGFARWIMRLPSPRAAPLLPPGDPSVPLPLRRCRGNRRR
jgi:hypothetical protein